MAAAAVDGRHPRRDNLRLPKKRPDVNNVLAGLVLLVACPSALLAQAPAGPQFEVNTYTTSLQYGASVAADGSGNFIVVWVSQGGHDGDGQGIFAQRYDASGKPRGSEFQVNSYTTGDQMYPAVASDSNGNFVVVRSEERRVGKEGS